MKHKITIVLISIVFNYALHSQELTLEMKPVINLSLAKIMANACEEDQKKSGYNPVNIAIVDDGGDLVLFRRQDNAFLLSIDIAQKKARSSAGIPYPTRKIEEIVYGKKDGKPGRAPGLAHSKDVVAFAGGLPIKTNNGNLIGAIGVSGATADQDEQCASAAIKAIEKALK
tara:strand:- start:254 stop:766 length:513 start_codon:yes stop_codon:yes gene_type:complete